MQERKKKSSQYSPKEFYFGGFHIINPFVEAFNFLPMFFFTSDCMMKSNKKLLFSDVRKRW